MIPNRKLCLVFIQVLLLVAFAKRGLASDTEEARLTLKGLKNINVVAELDPRTEAFGLTADQLQVDVELRLRKAGINVIKGGPVFLYVNVNALDSGAGTYAIAMEISFQQRVSLVRNPSIATWATTWNLSNIVATTPKEKYARFCRDYVADLVDRFINAYLSANKN